MTGLVLVTALLLRTQAAPAPELRDPFTVDPVVARSATLPVPVRLPSDLVDPFARTVTARTDKPIEPAPARVLPPTLVDPFTARPMPPRDPASGPAPSALADPFGRQS